MNNNAINNMINQLKPLWIGIVLALLTLLYGFGLGVTFGVAEDKIKDSLNSSAQEVVDSVYKNDDAKIAKITKKSWIYFKRAHLHANGMGTAALAMIMLISFSSLFTTGRTITAIALGLGGLGYSSFWMFAGMKAPGLASTGLAKEALTWLAFPSVVLFVGGTVSVLVIFLWSISKKTN